MKESSNCSWASLISELEGYVIMVRKWPIRICEFRRRESERVSSDDDKVQRVIVQVSGQVVLGRQWRLSGLSQGF